MYGSGKNRLSRRALIGVGGAVVAFGGAYFVFTNYLGSQRKAPIIVEAPKMATDKVLDVVSA